MRIALGRHAAALACWHLFPLLVGLGTPDVLLGQNVQRTATVHWQLVPLRDALARLESLFGEPVFFDRRIDPDARVSLDVEASNAHEVLVQIAAAHGFGVGRLGQLHYLGPQTAAEQLPAVAATRMEEIARLPRSQRVMLARKRRLTWPRLTEPRELVKSIVEPSGWRIEQAERIPHDLLPAGSLPPLALAEQLTVLLVGFDLTFEVRPSQRTIAIVPLKPGPVAARPQALGRPPLQRPTTVGSPREQRQVYTLRVKEQPLRAVLRELTQRLNWPLVVDEESIRAAGGSLDERVSFAVENADQETLLKALLQPAGLDFRHMGDRIQIVPRGESR